MMSIKLEINGTKIDEINVINVGEYKTRKGWYRYKIEGRIPKKLEYNGLSFIRDYMIYDASYGKEKILGYIKHFRSDGARVLALKVLRKILGA